MTTEGGRLRSISGRSARTSRTRVKGLPVGVAWMPMNTARWPFIATLEVQLCAARSTVAMSSNLTNAPFLLLTTICLNCATSVRPVLALTLVTVK